MSVTVDGYGNGELRAGVSCIPVIVDGYVFKDFDYTTVGCSLECLFKSFILNIANLRNGLCLYDNTAVSDFINNLIIANDFDRAGEAGHIGGDNLNGSTCKCRSINHNLTVAGDRGSSKKAVKVKGNRTALHYKRCRIGELGTNKDERTLMVVSFIVTVGGSRRKKHRIGKSEYGIRISGHKGTNLYITLIDGKDRL